LEYFENNFMAGYLKVYARADPNMGNRVQQEHPKIKVEEGWSLEHKNLQYL